MLVEHTIKSEVEIKLIVREKNDWCLFDQHASLHASCFLFLYKSPVLTGSTCTIYIEYSMYCMYFSQREVSEYRKGYYLHACVYNFCVSRQTVTCDLSS